MKTIPKSLSILILLTTFMLFSCVKFKENPLDPTTPTGFLLNFIENQNNDQESNQNQNNDQESNQNQGYTPDKILLFPTTQGGHDSNGRYNGNIKGTYNSAREAIDTICRNEFNNVIRVTYAGYDNIQNVRGFISIDENDYLSNYPNLYNVPTNVPIMGPDPNKLIQDRLVANDWADLWSDDQSQNYNYIRNKLYDAIGLSGSWWSGSDVYGQLYIDHNCDGWTTADTGYNGYTGSNSQQNIYWINNDSLSCGDYHNHNLNYLLCIAW